MKKAVSLLLAVLLCCGFAVQAFAAGITPSVANTAVQAGQDVEVELSIDDSYTDIVALETRLYYDSSLFTFKSGSGTKDVVAVNPTPKTDDAGKTYIQVSIVDATMKASVAAGEKIATVVFTASDAVSSDTAVEFSSAVFGGKTKDGTVIGTSEAKKTEFTITPPAPGYQVGVPAASSAGVNSQIVVPVSVQMTKADGTVETGKTFNAYSFDVSYDSNMLKFTGVESTADEKAEVTVTAGGRLRVAGVSHKAIACAADAIKLNFETYAASGTAEVTISNAKVDDKANAIDKDAPLAKTDGLTTKVAVGGFSVVLPDGFTGAAVANPGTDYTFTAPSDGNKYTISAKVDGKTVPVTDNGDGTYTIGAAYVSGSIVITAVAKQKVTVTFNANSEIEGVMPSIMVNGKAVTAPLTVFAGEDLTFSVTATLVFGLAAQSGNLRSIVKIGDTVIAAETMSMAGPPQAKNVTFTYTIPGSLITADTTVDATFKLDADTFQLVKSGNGWDDAALKAFGEDGAELAIDGALVPKTAKTLQLTIPQNDKRTYTVKYGTAANALAEVTGENGVYTMAYDGTSGAVYIDVSYAEKSEYEAVVSAYVNLGAVNGGRAQTMFLVTCGSKTNHVLTCNDQPMLWSDAYEAWAYLVISDKTAEEVKAEVVIKEAEGSKITVSYAGDVNLTGLVDVNDAQLVCNMYNADYADFATVSMEKFLRADVNGDKQLNTTDVAQIIAIVHK